MKPSSPLPPSSSPAPITSPIAALTATARLPLLEACLDAAKSSHSVFTRLYPDSARAAAMHTDAMQAAGVALSPLAGLPVSIKDLFDIAGETTMAGSVVLRGTAAASADAPAVARLRAAGAAILGKTNMTEFAYSGVGINPHYGTPVNPADAAVARIPGGSSSGSAVSVAAGYCAAAVGSDTGGSIRIPAALCGLVGFKSTARRVPTSGAVPLSTTLDTVCAMTRSVDDCVLMDRILSGQALEIPALPLAGLRLALPQTVVLDELDAHVAASFAAALSRLSAAGTQITELRLGLLQEAASINRFSPAEAYAWHRTFLAEHEEQYDRRVARRIRPGASMTAADYIDCHHRRRDWIMRMEGLLAPYDALILPTVPLVAPPIAELDGDDDAFFKANGLLLRNPSIINLLDGCAISLPCHAAGTLPVGVMLAAPAMADARLLAVARVVSAELARQ